MISTLSILGLFGLDLFGPKPKRPGPKRPRVRLLQQTRFLCLERKNITDSSHLLKNIYTIPVVLLSLLWTNNFGRTNAGTKNPVPKIFMRNTCFLSCNVGRCRLRRATVGFSCIWTPYPTWKRENTKTTYIHLDWFFYNCNRMWVRSPASSYRNHWKLHPDFNSRTKVENRKKSRYSIWNLQLHPI